jgi:hypothetical protein
VEWNIGESAGYLAAYCIKKGYIPREVKNSKTKLEELQKLIKKAGVELEWKTS